MLSLEAANVSLHPLSSQQSCFLHHHAHSSQIAAQGTLLPLAPESCAGRSPRISAHRSRPQSARSYATTVADAAEQQYGPHGGAGGAPRPATASPDRQRRVGAAYSQREFMLHELERAEARAAHQQA